MGGAAVVPSNPLYSISRRVQSLVSFRIAPDGKNSVDVDSYVQLMKPTYYVMDALNEQDSALVSTSWSLVLDFCREQPLLGVNSTAEDFFAMLFCLRLYEIRPELQSFYKDKYRLGHLIIQFVWAMMIQYSDETEMNRCFSKVALDLSSHGVLSNEYSVFGETLLWTLKTCVDKDFFTSAAEVAWTKLYSRILDFVLPHTVQYELNKRNEEAAAMAAIASRSNNCSLSNSRNGSIKKGDKLLDQVTSDSKLFDDLAKNQRSQVTQASLLMSTTSIKRDELSISFNNPMQLQQLQQRQSSLARNLSIETSQRSISVPADQLTLDLVMTQLLKKQKRRPTLSIDVDSLPSYFEDGV